MMSQGKFPQGFETTSKGDTIISSDGRKLKLAEDEDQRTTMENSVKIREFISETTTTGATSSATVIAEAEVPTEWKTIKSKETKNHLLVTFASKIAKEKGLSPFEGKKIADQLSFCVQLKIFSSEDIKLKGGQIKSIEGLEFDDHDRVLIPHIKVSKKSTGAKKKKNMLRLQIDKMMKDNTSRLDDIFLREE